MELPPDDISRSMIHDTLMTSIGYSNRAVMRRQLKATPYEKNGGFLTARFATGKNSHVFGMIDLRDGSNCLLGLSACPTRLKMLHNAQPLTIASKDDFKRYVAHCDDVSASYLDGQRRHACQVDMVRTVKLLKKRTKEMFSILPVCHQQLGRVYTDIQPMGVPRQKAKGQTLFRLITEVIVIKCGTVTVISLYDYNSRRVMSTLDYQACDNVARHSCLAMLK